MRWLENDWWTVDRDIGSVWKCFEPDNYHAQSFVQPPLHKRWADLMPWCLNRDADSPVPLEKLKQISLVVRVDWKLQQSSGSVTESVILIKFTFCRSAEQLESLESFKRSVDFGAESLVANFAKAKRAMSRSIV